MLRVSLFVIGQLDMRYLDMRYLGAQDSGQNLSIGAHLALFYARIGEMYHVLLQSLYEVSL